MNSFKNYLNKNRKGAMTFEWGITCPVMLMVLFIVIFMFLLIISYVNYSSFASNVASSMNFRSTGVENAVEAVKSLPNGGLNIRETVPGTVRRTPKINYANDGYNNNDVVDDVDTYTSAASAGSWLNRNLVRVNGSNAETAFKKAVYYYMNQHAGQVYFPFCYLDNKQLIQKTDGSFRSSNKSLTSNDTRPTISSNEHINVPFFIDVETLRMTSNTTATRVKLDNNTKTAANYANVLVKCDVKYNFFPIYMVGYTWPGMTIYTSGYSILT